MFNQVYLTYLNLLSATVFLFYRVIQKRNASGYTASININVSTNHAALTLVIVRNSYVHAGTFGSQRVMIKDKEIKDSLIEKTEIAVSSASKKGIRAMMIKLA